MSTYASCPHDLSKSNSRLPLAWMLIAAALIAPLTAHAQDWRQRWYDLSILDVKVEPVPIIELCPDQLFDEELPPDSEQAGSSVDRQSTAETAANGR